MNRLGATLAAIATLAAVGGVYVSGYRAGADAVRGKVRASEAAGLRAAQAAERRAAEITDRAATAYEADRERVRTVYRTIYREVPHALTPETDARFPMPVGLVRLHDAAALADPAFSDPAGLPDDAPSPVAASQLASAVVDNYETCNATAGRLTALQAWVREQSAAWGSQPPSH